MLSRTLAAVALVAIACSGCGAGGSSPSVVAGTPSPPTSPSAAPSLIDSPLVGEWVGVYDCEAIAEALTAAGQGEVAAEIITGSGLVPGATSADDLADPSNPCQDVIAVEHGHFFTADGRFGSRDADGNQVDDGTYEIVDDDTVLINGTEFGYEVAGDELTLESIPEGCVDDECIYSVMVAMAGQPLQRQD